LDYASVKRFLIGLSERIVRAKDELNAMDAACGDGDFGITMASAFIQVKKSVEVDASNDIGTILKIAGTAIMAAGGASGPTIATIYIEAGNTVKGKREIGLEELASMFQRAAEKIHLLGGAEKGDKTMIDALQPAVGSLINAANEGIPLQTALDRAAEAARVGCESTKDLIAKRGRARYLGDQTLGHVDPGAYFVSMMFTSLASNNPAGLT